MKHESLFKAMVAGNSVVYDVGGHRGAYALIFSELVRPQGKVYCFEPNPEKFAHLKTRADACSLKNITPYQMAVSDTTGTTTLYFGDETKADEASTICPELATHDRLGVAIRKVDVRTTSLDDFNYTVSAAPTFVKIDVEGAENRVLAGMTNIIQQSRPIILFECGVSGEIPGHFAALREQGYVLWAVDLTRFIGEPHSWDNTVNSSTAVLDDKIFSFRDEELMAAKPALTNIVCIHRDHVAKFVPDAMVMPLRVALQHLRRPHSSFGAKVLKYLPTRVAGALRGLKRRLLNK